MFIMLIARIPSISSFMHLGSFNFHCIHAGLRVNTDTLINSEYFLTLYFCIVKLLKHQIIVSKVNITMFDGKLLNCL